MYDALKFIHVLGVFVYVGGFLTLTRLLGKAVRYESAVSRADALATLRRMHKFVDWGGLALMLVAGVWILVDDPVGKTYMKAGYFHMKLTFVIVLLVCDVLVTRKFFAMDPEHPPGPAFFRIMHGVVGLCLIGILAAIFLIR